MFADGSSGRGRSRFAYYITPLNRSLNEWSLIYFFPWLRCTEHWIIWISISSSLRSFHVFFFFLFIELDFFFLGVLKNSRIKKQTFIWSDRMKSAGEFKMSHLLIFRAIKYNLVFIIHVVHFVWLVVYVTETFKCTEWPQKLTVFMCRRVDYSTLHVYTFHVEYHFAFIIERVSVWDSEQVGVWKRVIGRKYE